MILQLAPIVIAFGANLGDRAGTIRSAQDELSRHPRVRELRCSLLYESLAVTPEGVSESKPKYLNGVALAMTELSPEALLDTLQEIELRHGRVRSERWGDRTLDIDIIAYAGRVQRTPRLTLPHPRAHERDFVLAPWLELEPAAVLIRHGRVRDLLKQVGDHTAVWREEP